MFKTFAGMGQNAASDIIATGGLVGATAQTAWQKTFGSQSNETSGYNLKELFGYNLVNNPLSKYADDISKTGAYLPSR